MKNIFLLIIAFLNFATAVQSQKEYFQQEVNYKIDVSLDDEKHELSGTIEMEYINNSPDALSEIYLHLWANAYKNRETAFAKQKLRDGSTTFYFAEDRFLGNFSRLNFMVDGVSATWNYLPNDPDIALLELPKDLPSGGKIIISTPFTLKIPGSFSRLGHVGESYQMTQWYPKPAVYDRDGWHPMPYLDIGEFYSEFGDFDVKITLPANYVVGATGQLQTASEFDFLNQKAKETESYLAQLDVPVVVDTFPTSSTEMKTLHYTAEQVHDFAWFDDKRFYVQKSEVKFDSGRTVDTWTMFTDVEADLWKESINYVDRSVKFYSEMVGEYPYPQATAVQSALSAGGGMEYPMITVIGVSGDAQALDIVITHEVGHNWFYGILAFDERDHAWLDEGINSYYDHRYNSLYYEDSSTDFLPPFMMKKTDYSLEELAYLLQARRNIDQASEMTSNEFVPINYFLSAYEKPAQVFKYLEYYLGTVVFDEAMQSFYQKWAFKHPQPEDLRAHLIESTGKELPWFFEGLINSAGKVDYALKKLTDSDQAYVVTVKNKGQIKSPFPLSGLKDGEIVSTKWYEGFAGEQEITFPKGDYDQLVIDEERLILDVNRRNNNIRVKGPFKTFEPLQFQTLTGLENTKKTTLYWLPLLTWNNYDKTMLGLALYNTSLVPNKFEFALAPQVSLLNGELSGLGHLKYNFFTNNDLFERVTLGVGFRSYNRNYNHRFGYYQRYTRIAPRIDFRFAKRKAVSKSSHRLSLRSVFLQDEYPRFSVEGEFLDNDKEWSMINQLIYTFRKKTALHPLSFEVILEQQQYDDAFGESQQYLKATLELNTAFTYAKRKNFDIRIFGGAFLDNSQREAGGVSQRSIRGSFNLTHQGFNDYIYDDIYFGRGDRSGIWTQQISLRDGGLKNAFGPQSSVGQSNNFILALNLKADLPMRFPLDLPLKPFFDIGYFDNAMPSVVNPSFSDQLLWSGGLMLDFFDGIVGVYVPLVYSNNMDLPYADRDGGSFWSRITFSIDFNRANPWKLWDEVEF